MKKRQGDHILLRWRQEYIDTSSLFLSDRWRLTSVSPIESGRDRPGTYGAHRVHIVVFCSRRVSR